MFRQNCREAVNLGLLQVFRALLEAFLQQPIAGPWTKSAKSCPGCKVRLKRSIICVLALPQRYGAFHKYHKWGSPQIIRFRFGCSISESVQLLGLLHGNTQILPQSSEWHHVTSPLAPQFFLALPKNMVPYGTLQISWFHKIWFNLSSSVPLLLRIAITDQNPFENTEYTPFSDFSDKPCYLSSYIPANEYHPQFLPTGYTSVKSPMAIFQDCCFHCIPDCQVYSKTYDSAEPQWDS